MISGIYKITNTCNERVYIGSAKDIKTRWRNHLYRLRHNKHANAFLQADFNKCKEQAFTFCILEECPIDKLIGCEQLWLDAHYDKQEKCYNLRVVAESNRGFRFSDATKQKMSQLKKGIKPSPQTIAASRAARTGTKLSEETCKKMSQFQSSRSKEHNQKLGFAQLRKWQDPEYKAKMKLVHQVPRLNRRKKIIQLTSEGVIVGTYLGAKEASAATGANASCIRQVALGTKKSAGGFLWKYEE